MSQGHSSSGASARTHDKPVVALMRSSFTSSALIAGLSLSLFGCSTGSPPPATACPSVEYLREFGMEGVLRDDRPKDNRLVSCEYTSGSEDTGLWALVLTSFDDGSSPTDGLPSVQERLGGQDVDFDTFPVRGRFNVAPAEGGGTYLNLTGVDASEQFLVMVAGVTREDIDLSDDDAQPILVAYLTALLDVARERQGLRP